MFTALRISNASSECGLFSEGRIRENFLKGFLERSDLLIYMERMEL